MRDFIFFGTLLVLLSCNNLQESKDLGTCSGIEESAEGLKVKSFFYEKYGNDNLLAIEKEEVLGAASSLASFKVHPAYPFESAEAWSIFFSASNIDVKKNLLIAESSLEGMSTSYEVFSLQEGNKLIDYTYDKFEVLFSSETEKRFLGFYSKNAANKVLDAELFDDRTLGIFSYVSLNGRGQKYLVKVVNVEDVDSFDISSPVVELLALKQNAVELNSGKTLYFTGEDGLNSNAINFDVQVTLYTLNAYEPISFILQVRNDALVVNPDNFIGLPFVLEKID